MNFKDRYISGQCSIDAVDDCVDEWHNGAGSGLELHEYLGLSNQEYTIWLRNGDLESLLVPQRKNQRFRIYQLEFGENNEPKPWAFCGIEVLHKAGHEQPPASEYRLIHDGELYCNVASPHVSVLNIIFSRYNNDLPDGYLGRSVSPSDVIELYNDNERRYFYCNPKGFAEVKFSPKFALPMKVMQYAAPSRWSRLNKRRGTGLYRRPGLH